MAEFQRSNGVHLQQLFEDPERGVMLRTVDDLLQRIAELEAEAKETHRMCKMEVQVSYYQVYREKVYCLLQPKADKRSMPLRVREDPQGAYVDGLTQYRVTRVEDIVTLLEIGTMHRRVATTAKNNLSSRSHAVFTVRLRRVGDSEETSFASTLHLVDLAGSERTGDPQHPQGGSPSIHNRYTMGRQQQQQSFSVGETSDINAALSCLGRVIHVLAANAENGQRRRLEQSPSATARSRHSPSPRTGTGRSVTPPASSRARQQRGTSPSLGRATSTTANSPTAKLHVPYRESVLTFLLKDCLGGNARTAMLSTISPSFEDMGETLSTLRYASRARRIVNHPVPNTDARSAEVAATLRQEIRHLQLQLKDAVGVGGAQVRELEEQLQEREESMMTYEARLQEAQDERSAWGGRTDRIVRKNASGFRGAAAIRNDARIVSKSEYCSPKTVGIIGPVVSSRGRGKVIRTGSCSHSNTASVKIRRNICCCSFYNSKCHQGCGSNDITDAAAAGAEK
jgi:kinesin family protein 1